MAITPRSKGLGNIGAIVDRQGRASPAAPKAPVKPTSVSKPKIAAPVQPGPRPVVRKPATAPAPKPVAKVAPKPAPKIATKPNPFAMTPEQRRGQNDTRAPGGGGMDINGNPIGGGMGGQMNIARPGQGNLARNTGPGNAAPGGPGNGSPYLMPRPGGPIDYEAELNKDGSYSIGTGQGPSTPVRRREDASEAYFNSLIDAAGGYDQYKAKNPGKDVFTINQDFQRLTPEQQYGYLSYRSPENSATNRPPSTGTPPPKSIYDQFGIPPTAQEPFGYQYNGPPPMDPSTPYDMPQTAPDFGNYDNLPPVPMPYLPGGPSSGIEPPNDMYNPYMPPEPPPGYDYGGPFTPRPDMGPGGMFGQLGPQISNSIGGMFGNMFGNQPDMPNQGMINQGVDFLGQQMGMPNFGSGQPQPQPGFGGEVYDMPMLDRSQLDPNYGMGAGQQALQMGQQGLGQMFGNPDMDGEPAPYTGGMMSPRRVINQVGKPGFQPRPTMQSAFSPQGNNFGGDGFMGGSGSLFGGGGFAGK